MSQTDGQENKSKLFLKKKLEIKVEQEEKQCERRDRTAVGGEIPQ